MTSNSPFFAYGIYNNLYISQISLIDSCSDVAGIINYNKQQAGVILLIISMLQTDVVLQRLW